MNEPTGTQPDFSLVSGGPLHQLWRGTRLTDDDLQLLHRRLVAIVVLAWAPLLLLSIAEGRAWGDAVSLTFLRDVELHVRLLIALPLMIVAELIVHQRMRPVVGQFLDRGLIPDAARPQFDAAIASADEPLIGTADIQSQADLGNRFEVVTGMRWVPCSRHAAACAAADPDDALGGTVARAVARPGLLTRRMIMTAAAPR